MGHFLMTVVAIAAVSTFGCGAGKQHAALQKKAENLHVELAETYISKGAPEAAIPLLRRIIAERPNDARVRVLYATVLRDLGLYPQSLAQFEVALDIAPDYAPAHAGLGILCDLMKEPSRARQHHERAAALQPGFAPYHNNLGFSLYLAGDLDGAVRELEQALALDPSLTIAYNNLGFAYGSRGQFEKAQRAFRTIGAEPATLLNMSLVHEGCGNHQQATELREQAYALAPDLRPDQETTP